MRVLLCTAVLLHAAVSSSWAQDKPIMLHPENPHYFQYKNKPAVLITSGEHYGAVINLDFDYNKYLRTLESDHLNLTRVFTGIYVEPMGAFNIEKNVLAPDSDRYITPWARSSEPGYAGGGNKFDFSRWDDQYFTRLRDFVKEAEKRNIIVELTLFCPFYEKKQWVLSPLYPGNNINNTPLVGKDSVYTLDHSGSLLQIQEQLVIKMVTELNGFSNLMFEICNEPYFGGVTMEWQHHIAALIEKTEKSLPQKHLITQNIANDSARITAPHPGVSVFNFHYATPPTAVKQNYHLNKVIGDNETGFRGRADSTYRKEGWEFIMAGGALYNNLDYSFVSGHEDGTWKYHDKQPGGGSQALRRQLSHLKAFIEGFDFVHMVPVQNYRVTSEAPSRIHVLAGAGDQYAAYLLHGRTAILSFPMPAGKYEVTWIDPASGAVLSSALRKHRKGDFDITSPAYDFDIALRIIRKR